MYHFDIRSKIYCEPSKKDAILYVFINVAVVVMVFCSVLSLLVKGIRIGSISGCIIAIVVGFLMRSRNGRKGHYEFCIMSIDISLQSISISFLPNYNKQIEVDICSIRSIEYSDQLECVRFISDYQEMSKTYKVDKVQSELLLYISYRDNKEFYDVLENIINKPIVFIDR